MALYKLFLRPVGRYPYQNHLTVQICKNEAGSLKWPNSHCSNRCFQTSSTLGKPKWRMKSSKSNSKEFKSPAQFSGEELESIQSSQFSLNMLTKPFFFTIAFSTASIVGTAIWQYENIRRRTVFKMKNNWISEKIFRNGKKRYNWRQEVNKYWNQLTEGEKLFVPICLINILVFMAWKVKRFEPTMIKYFCSSPFAKSSCLPMVLATFSHYNVFHLAANMYVLHNFSSSGVHILGKEQFLGLYLSAGVISSFTSYLYKAARSQHSLSVGASGAIMAIVAYMCTKNPDAEVAIIFLPWFAFPAGSGIKFLMALDLVGVLRGWKYIDHAAHLGGALCGVYVFWVILQAWCYWGNTYIWKKREPLLQWWHELRSPSK